MRVSIQVCSNPQESAGEAALVRGQISTDHHSVRRRGRAPCSMLSIMLRVASLSTKRRVGLPPGRSQRAARFSHSKRNVVTERSRKSPVLLAVRGFLVAVVRS